MNNGLRSWDLWLAIAGLTSVSLLAGFSLARSYRIEADTFEEKVNASLQFFREIVDPGDPFHDLLEKAGGDSLTPEQKKLLESQFQEHLLAAFNPLMSERQTMVAGIVSVASQRQLCGQTPGPDMLTFAKNLDRNCCQLQLRVAFPGVSWWTPFTAMGWELLLTTVAVFGFLGSIFFSRRALQKQKRLNHWHRDFANQMLHGLKTPLSTMQLGLKCLDTEVTDSGNAILGPMKRAQKNMGEVLEQFVTSIASHPDRVVSQRTRVNLSELLDQLVSEFSIMAHENEARISLAIPEGDWFASANVLDLRQILSLLLENALVHGGRGVQICIGLEKRDTFLHIHISDNGPGIDKSQHALVFQPFYRANEGVDKGLGLGLYVARNLARSNHGDLKLLPHKRPGCRLLLVLEATEAGEP